MSPVRQPIAQPRILSSSGVQKAQRSSPLSRRHRRGRQEAKIIPLMEVGARVWVNSLLVALGVSSLGHLFPYIYNQSRSLAEMQVAIQRAEASHLKLRADLSRYFDPTQLQQLIEEQTGYQDTQERPVVWINPTTH